MWVTKLLISPVKKRIFCPKTTKFSPKLAFLPGLAASFGSPFGGLVGGLVGGCGARAVSRKTPIYFNGEMETIEIELKARNSTYHETGITPEPSVRAPIKWT